MVRNSNEKKVRIKETENPLGSNSSVLPIEWVNRAAIRKKLFCHRNLWGNQL